MAPMRRGTRSRRGGSGRGRRHTHGAAGAHRRSPAAAPSGWDATGYDEAGVSSAGSDQLVSFSDDIKAFFSGTPSLERHVEAQTEHRTRYLVAISVLEELGVSLSQSSKVRALAAGWIRKDSELINALLSRKDHFGFVEICRATNLLDARRRKNALSRRLKRLEETPGAKLSNRKRGSFKSEIDGLEKVSTSMGSVTGALSKRVRRWSRTLTKDELEFFALHMPNDPWKKLADIVHFNPKKDFPALPWFLPYKYGKDAPADSMVSRCKSLTSENVNELLKEFEIPFSHLKNVRSALNEESKRKISAYSKLEHVLWNYEDLMCDGTNQVIQSRLSQGEDLGLTNGSLLERLLRMKMIREDIKHSNQEYVWCEETETLSERKRKANKKLVPFYEMLREMVQERINQISVSLPSPIVVIGDRSGSMDIAIRVSTIVAGLISSITAAKLVFFNNENKDVEVPKNIEEVLTMAVTISAEKSTAPAASLYPFYKKQEMVKTFIIVTDEEENTAHENYRFAELFKKYRDEVYKANIVFISFLREQHQTGQMVKELKKLDIHPKEMKFDKVKPDMTKLDKLIAELSTKTESFEEKMQSAEESFQSEGVTNYFEKLTV